MSWRLGNLLTRTTPSNVRTAEPPARDLTIMASDGIALTATYWPGLTTNAPGVLLLHGNGSSRGAMRTNAAWLATLGYAVLTIDFRGHGGSTPTRHSFGLNESRDAEAAFNWLKQAQHGAPVGVIGISLGGAATLLGQHGPLPTNALILQAVYPDIRHAIRNRLATLASPSLAVIVEPLLSYQSRLRFDVWPERLSPLTAIAAYHGPVMIIGGANDPYTPPKESRRIFAAAQGPKVLWVVDGLSHTGISGFHNKAYRARVAQFLKHWIGQSLAPMPRSSF